MDSNKKRILIFDADYDDGTQNTALAIKNILINSEVDIARVCKNEFPTNLDYDGYIITGSNANVIDGDEWITKFKELLKTINTNKPLLAICFGHQCIAKVLGGKIEKMNERSFGYKEVILTRAGTEDPLFLNLSNPFICFQSNRYTVSDIPENSVLLGNASDQNLSFRYNNWFGIQFHPEITPKIAITIAEYRDLQIEKTKSDSLKYGRPALQIIINFENLLNIL